MPPFRQPAPTPRNRWRTQPALRHTLERLLPPDLFHHLAPALDAFAQRCAETFPALALAAEATPPRHLPYDPWGNRIDRIEHSRAFTTLIQEAQSAGLVATAHDPAHSPHGRLIQSALLALFEPVAATATCPLAMTDAAATLLKTHDPALHAQYGARLIARENAITSGQWMTETSGGSDLSALETTATPAPEGWRLHGLKWFASAPASDIAIVLARTKDAPPGAAGLSLFLLDLHTPAGAWNGIEIRRLKDKLGTRAMPTAEIDLRGALAHPIGGIGRGVAKAAAMLNVARLWAGQAAPAAASYLLDLARTYAHRRTIGGTPLAHIPAHAAWLATIAARHEALLALCLETAQHAGAPGPNLARLLAPAMKFHCAREGLTLCSELLESFGGAGYLEDTGIPAIFRNAHVHTIWEGTSGVMAADVVRALATPGLAQAWRDSTAARLAALNTTPATRIAADLATIAPELADPDPANARRIAGAIAAITAATALAESAAWRQTEKQDRTGMLALARVLQHPLVQPPAGLDDAALAFSENQGGAEAL